MLKYTVIMGDCFDIFVLPVSPQILTEEIMSRILVADDESRIRRLVCDFLHNSGYETVEASDGNEAVAKFSSDKSISLVVCDIMMPGLDGWAVCKKIRETSNIPIIVLTARTMEFDELSSFEAGADDFVTKPFSPTVLVKRIEALLKRSSGRQNIVSGEVYSLDGLMLDIPGHSVTINSVEVELTIKEHAIFEKLMTNQGKIFSRDNLLESIWGADFEGEARTVDSHVARLRTKLGAWGEKHLKTVFGVGYKIEVNKP